MYRYNSGQVFNTMISDVIAIKCDRLRHTYAIALRWTWKSQVWHRMAAFRSTSNKSIRNAHAFFLPSGTQNTRNRWQSHGFDNLIQIAVVHLIRALSPFDISLIVIKRLSQRCTSVMHIFPLIFCNESMDSFIFSILYVYDGRGKIHGKICAACRRRDTSMISLVWVRFTKTFVEFFLELEMAS